MTYETVHEPINVFASFVGRKVVPHAFLWGRKRYTIKKLNLVHSERQGRDIVFYFSVSDEANTFKLAFNPMELQWSLEEVYSE
ncbi:MAG: hypothetical protein Q8Q20_05970 [bacterium]|nr:hypothetical protein [bacterium]